MAPIRVAGTRSASASALADSPSGCMNSSRRTSPGCVRMRPSRLPLSVIVDDLDILGTLPPHETDPPLIIDPDRVLTGAIALQSFETIAGRQAQVLQARGRVQHVQLAGRDAGDAPEPCRGRALKQGSRRLVPKAPD